MRRRRRFPFHSVLHAPPRPERLPGGLSLAVSLAAVVLLGDSLVCGQAPPAAAPPTPSENVIEIRITGNKRADTKKILSQIRTRTGRPFDPKLIEEDVRRLYKTGWFVTVRPQSQQVPGGRVVIFDVLERPLVEYVKYVGNQKIVKKKLAKEANIKPGDAMSLYDVEEARRRIEDYYRGHGFPAARVSIAEGDKASDRGVVFVINEGHKQRVWHTEFIGNTIASDARLKTQIRSKPGYFWLIKGEVNRDEIDEDINRLTAYYRGLGFFSARIGRYLEFNESNNWLTLTFVIDEGPRYTIRDVSFVGNTKFSSEELAGAVNLHPGAFFNQADMLHDEAAIRDTYGSVGYIFADANADPRFLEEPGQLDLVYDVREGFRCRVGKIIPRIEGEFPHTRITTVLNRMSLTPGDIVDIRELRASERRLQLSGLFEVDPQRGTAPKIVFSPPNLEDIEVRQASHDEAARGQSPAPAPYSAYRPPLPPGWAPEDRAVDLSVEGKWIGDGQADGVYPQQQPYPSTQPAPSQSVNPQSSTLNWQPSSPAGCNRRAWVANSQPSSFSPHPAALNPQPSTIVRGQYSADTGRSVPTVHSAPSYVAANPYGPSGQQAWAPPPGQLPPPATDPRSSPYSVVPDITYSQPGIGPNGQTLLGGTPDDQAPLYIPLEPTVQETRTGRFMLSVGVNSDAGLLGSVIVDEQNFDLMRFPRSWEDIRQGTAWRGAGQRFRLELSPGTEVQRYTINFEEPYLLNTRISMGTSGYFYNRRFLEWDEERVGGRVAFGYQFTHDLSGTLAYRGAKINISDPIRLGIPELDEVLGNNALHGFEARLSHDTRDNRYLATQGHLVELSFEQVIGSFVYPRAELDMSRYFMLHQRPDGSGRHVLGLSSRVAVTGEDTPIYEHYYAGGYMSLRGFDFRGVSPTNAGVAVGGEFMMLGSIEYMFPITADDAIRGVVFCDSGTVEPTINNWTDKYRVSPGFGLRITVPAMGSAPIALDFGFPIATNPGDDEELFSFWIGWQR